MNLHNQKDHIKEDKSTNLIPHSLFSPKQQEFKLKEGPRSSPITHTLEIPANSSTSSIAIVQTKSPPPPPDLDFQSPSNSEEILPFMNHNSPNPNNNNNTTIHYNNQRESSFEKYFFQPPPPALQEEEKNAPPHLALPPKAIPSEQESLVLPIDRGDRKNKFSQQEPFSRIEPQTLSCSGSNHSTNNKTRIPSLHLENSTNPEEEIISKYNHQHQHQHQQQQPLLSFHKKVPSDDTFLASSSSSLDSKHIKQHHLSLHSREPFFQEYSNPTSRRTHSKLGKTKFDSYFDFRGLSSRSASKRQQQQPQKEHNFQANQIHTLSSETQNLLVEISSEKELSIAQQEEEPQNIVYQESTSQNLENMTNTPPKKASKLRVFWATACFSGLQFGWALRKY